MHRPGSLLLSFQLFLIAVCPTRPGVAVFRLPSSLIRTLYWNFRIRRTFHWTLHIRTNFYLLHGHLFFCFLHSCTVFTGSDTRRAENRMF
ncbi:uncharacterized protein EV420DRAFT_1559254 [Desarmillaria tabescens]|uniref:Secreted protein n=1 Tax=Armillaria tabescens TaxID=1929756 RepID=A0AA39K070_ARMTA|nr:uncharacterized protein EV420DRAFT_1559254 [Desarmillaria tabescens]KAK0452167.1 hypothetical protein EV420DRAFT_1559254 [Desarmillaria tabescens]